VGFYLPHDTPCVLMTPLVFSSHQSYSAALNISNNNKSTGRCVNINHNKHSCRCSSSTALYKFYRIYFDCTCSIHYRKVHWYYISYAILICRNTKKTSLQNTMLIDGNTISAPLHNSSVLP